VQKLKALLAKRQTLFVCVVLGIALCVPALGNNLQAEDYGHRAAARADPWRASLYPAGKADPMATYYLKDRGILPWITVPNLHVSFFRPLAALTLHVDYRFWPERPALMFAHSLAWLSLLLGASIWLYQRVIRPEWAAGLAALLTAFDDAQGAAIGWLAARHTLVASALGVVSIVCHDRWRRSEWKPGAWLAPATLLLALCAGEIGVGAIAYLIAHAIFLDPAPWRKRWRFAAGWLAAASIWLVLYARSSAGAYGSGVYAHPIGEPLAFIAALAERLPFLLLGLFWAPGADIWLFVPRTDHAGLFWVPWTVTLVILALIAPVVRRDRSAQFWLAGMLFSAVPLCSAPPADRVLMFPALGGMALVAITIARLSDRDPSLPATRLWRWPARAMTWVWYLLLLFISPLVRPLRAIALQGHNDSMLQVADDLYAGQGPRVEHLIIVNAPDYYTGTGAASMGALRHPPGAACVRVLYGGLDPIEVSRPGEHELLVRAPLGFMNSGFNRVFRGPNHPFRKGEGLQLTRLQIIVEEVNAQGGPAVTRFRFNDVLEAPVLRFMSFRNGRYVPFSLPAVGQSVIVRPFVPGA
jgi:hypothetical protein